MRNPLLFLSFFIFAQLSYAQMSFSPIGTSYQYKIDAFSQYTHSESIISEKDTLVDGQLNRKLLATHVAEDDLGQKFREQYVILVRESNDSIFMNGKLNYYLGAREKDTIYIYDDNYLVLDSIRYGVYFEAKTKVYYFRQRAYQGNHMSDCDYWYDITFVQNYGPINHHLPLRKMGFCEPTDLPSYNLVCGSLEGNLFDREACSALSTDGRINEMNLPIHPNPATSEVNLMFTDGDLNIELFNSLGIKVYETYRSGGGNHTLDVSNLSNGVYQVRINGGSVRSMQFVKQ
ncbi:MAG TPA: T9SS type A sorting domain-containing protein [Cytophagaceae bacterium]|jgi:hypothetical protein